MKDEIVFDIHNPITIKELPRLMDKLDLKGQPLPFSLIAITCNVSQNQGGEIVILQYVVQYRNIKLINTDAKAIEIQQSLIPKITPKLAERIRRLYNPSDDTIRNVNIRYITHFKGNNDSKFRRITY